MNNLKTVYETWSDDQLLDAYKQRNGYQEEAQKILFQVMQGKNLSEEMARIQQHEEKEAIRIFETTTMAEEIKTFGKYIPDKVFAAAAKKNDGSYFKAKLSADKNPSMLSLVIFVEMALIIGAILYISIEGWQLPGILLVAGAVFFLAAVYRVIPGRASMNLYENLSRKIVLEIKQKSSTIEIRFPFSYKFLTTTIATPARIGVVHFKIKNPYLYFLAERNDGAPILIREPLASWDHEPLWESTADNQDGIRKSVTYSIIGLSKKKLKELKKILDGLSEGV